MNLKAIFYFLGKLNLLIVFFSIINLIYCLYFNFNLNIHVYLITLIFSLIFFYLSKRIKSNEENLKSYNLISLAILGWIILPAIISIPFWLGGYENFLNSYFETLSGFTSFGASVFIEKLNFLDSPLLLWRASTQLMGAIFFVITIILILGNKEINLYPIKFIMKKKETVYFSINFENIFNNTCYAFVILFLISLFFLNFTDLRILDKFTLSLTIISTGGFFISDLVLSNSDKLVISFLLILSSLNIFLILGLFKINNTYTFFEDRYFLLAYIFFFITLVFFTNNIHYSDLLILLSSSISNSGLNLSDSDSDNFVFILISASFLGGCLISSTSGFKVSRILIIFNKIYSELIKLLTPSAVINSTIFKSNEKIKSKDFYSCSLLLFFYILMFVIYSFILTLENIKFEDSFLTAILLTLNTLPSNIFVSEDIDFTNFSNLTIIFTCIMLILSKVTPLSIIALVKYRFLK